MGGHKAAHFFFGAESPVKLSEQLPPKITRPIDWPNKGSVVKTF